MDKVRVALQATDPLSRAGLAGLLQSRPELTLLGADQRTVDVLVVSVQRLSAGAVAALRRAATETGAPIVLITEEITEAELLTAVDCRVVAILPRAAVTGERLAHSVTAAAGGGAIMPPHLVGELLKHIERLQRTMSGPYSANRSGLTAREIDVLRLMAEGLDTHEIATKLCYSQRTVKNVVYGMTQRLQLRNRSHAVAYAIRAGII
ncbi:helix-turn-helix transcriptional regulator [Jidongwangia harbinensis]|uniref:helix-turn-helix transcriptional regulator n=1 Tax=Jidongwangia harbinensis TaxID=2878561 RepID=UPI001CDA40A2|nr:response regulator transcription factor [Jidongwangia harbinensis]MCA2211853.1 response regulator transcription factor [Jidongwangia harbinensis]